MNCNWAQMGHTITNTTIAVTKSQEEGCVQWEWGIMWLRDGANDTTNHFIAVNLCEVSLLALRIGYYKFNCHYYPPLIACSLRCLIFLKFTQSWCRSILCLKEWENTCTCTYMYNNVHAVEVTCTTHGIVWVVVSLPCPSESPSPYLKTYENMRGQKFSTLH